MQLSDLEEKGHEQNVSSKSSSATEARWAIKQQKKGPQTPCPHDQRDVWGGVSFINREVAVFGSDDYVAVECSPQTPHQWSHRVAESRISWAVGETVAGKGWSRPGRSRAAEPRDEASQHGGDRTHQTYKWRRMTRQRTSLPCAAVEIFRKIDRHPVSNDDKLSGVSVVITHGLRIAEAVGDISIVIEGLGRCERHKTIYQTFGAAGQKDFRFGGDFLKNRASWPARDSGV